MTTLSWWTITTNNAIRCNMLCTAAEAEINTSSDDLLHSGLYAAGKYEFNGTAFVEIFVDIEKEIVVALTASVQVILDSTARQRNYDGILSLCSYATSLDPVFKAEGQAGVEWRDACWRMAYTVMDEVKAGMRDVPTAEELVALLPEMVWP